MPHPKGGYKNKLKKKVPGVTTILGRFKESGGLMYWAFEQGKAAERGEINSLHDKRDEAADAGTLAHDLVEAHIKGQPISPIPSPTTLERLRAAEAAINNVGDSEVPPDILKDFEAAERQLHTETQAWQGFQNYLAWRDNNRMQIVRTEVQLVSEIYQFGGCLDALGMDNDFRLCLVDWKTSNAVYPDMAAQVAAYKVLWEENNPDQPIHGGYHLLRFSKEHADFTHHYWQELDVAWQYFIRCRELYDIYNELKGRVK